jgi:hypothetical protein
MGQAIEVWRSVREGNDTKTRRSHRTLRLLERCVAALAEQVERQTVMRATAGDRWQHRNLVFCSATGTELDAAHVRRDFRRVVNRTPA